MQPYTFPDKINQSIYFDYTPVPTYAGHLNRHPFRVVITSPSDNDHYILLDSRYSRSYHPQQTINKWTFLRPECRFLDLSGNQITTIKTNDTILYVDENNNINSVSGNFFGVSGFAEFYFVDDWFNFDLAFKPTEYTCMVATLLTSGINYFDPNENHLLSTDASNSNAIAVQPHIFLYRPPDYIKISENGIRDYINPRWIAATQPVVFSLNWKPTYNITLADGNQIQPINIPFNFCKHHPYSSTDLPINIKPDMVLISSTGFIKTTALSAIFLNDLNIYYEDYDQYLTAGYNKNSFIFFIKTTLNCALTANCNFQTHDSFGNDYSPKVWLSNPFGGNMTIMEYHDPEIFTLEDSKQFLKSQIFNFSVPVQSQNQSTDSFYTSGYHGINSVAVLPYPDCTAWATDGELNYLYKFSTNGNILSSIDLTVSFDDASPTSIVLDKNKNIWITLYDTLSVIKFSTLENTFSSFNIGSLVQYIDPPNIDINWYHDNFDYPNTKTDSLIQPTYLDSDMDNNIWVTFSNYASGFVLKLDNYGSLLKQISYPPKSCPQDIIVDNQNNVWIAMSNNIWNTQGYIEKRDKDGNLITRFGPIMGINNLALDAYQNLWYTYGYDGIGKIDNKYQTIETQVLNIPRDPNYIKPNIGTTETALEGIACDERGYVYVVNSVQNKIHIFNQLDFTLVDEFYVNPQGLTFYVNEENGETLKTYNPYQKSLQAFGDWTGFKWNNKYNRYAIDYPATYTLNLTGASNRIDAFQSDSTALQQSTSLLATTNLHGIDTTYQVHVIVDQVETALPQYLNNIIDVYKVNENFDLAAQIRSVTFMESLYESDLLFNTFLPSVFGYPPLTHFDLGVVCYEKISNFIKNTKDIDTAGIDYVYDMSDLLNDDSNDYRITYPSNTKRLMDILSINQSRLWGSSAKNQDNFEKASSEGIFNRGNLLTLNYQVTAGTPVVLKTKSLKTYRKIETGPLSGINVYPLEELVIFLGLNQKLPTSWNDFYEFYEFIPGTSEIQVDGIIDWQNGFTTLNKNISSFFDWVGNEQNIDRLLSYDLYNGLGLL